MNTIKKEQHLDLIYDLFKPSFIALPIIFLIAATTQAIRYIYFDVNIFDWITVTELLTPFVHDASICIVSLIVFAMFYCVLALFITKTTSEWNFKDAVFDARLPALLTGLLSSIVLLIGFLIVRFLPQYFFISSCALAFALATLMSFNILTFFSRKLEFKLRLHAVLLMFVTTFTISASAAFQIDNVIKTEKKAYSGTIFTYQNNTQYIISDSLLFVGKTERYLILYNRNSKSPVLVSTNELTKIEYHYNYKP